MKLKYNTFLILNLLTAFIVKAQLPQIGTITSSLGNQSYFVQGISPVNNVITATAASAYYIDFYLTNFDQTIYYDSLIDNTGNHTSKSWQYDMGVLDTNMFFLIYFRDNSNNYIGYNYYWPYITTKPAWLNVGWVNNVAVNNNIIEMDATYPIAGFLDEAIPANIKGINGMPFKITENNISFHIDYNMTDKTSTITNVKAKLKLNTLGQSVYNREIPLGQNGTFELDEEFNLTAMIMDSINTPKYDITFPGITFPIAPPLASLKIDGGVGFYATLKGQIVIGQVGGQWGFINNNGEKTKILAIATGYGWVRATASVLLGAAKVRGTLQITGRIGGGFDFINIPSSQVNPIFGGDIDVSGTLEGSLGWGLFKKTYGPKSFYYASFGDPLKKAFDNSYNTEYNSFAKTFKKNASFNLPEYNPQPVFGIRSNNVYCTWIENDVTDGWLLLSKLNNANNSFTEPLIVEQNNNSIVNPKIGVFPDGSAIITWSQNRYNTSNIPNNIEIQDLVKAQDIWFAIYDNETNEIVYSDMLADDNSGFTTGRAEGNAEVTMGSGSEGLITWVASDDQFGTSDIWYSKVTAETTGWTYTIPEKIAEMPGANKNLKVAYFDSTTAIAVWVNDPDGFDTTNNNLIYYATYDGNVWNAPVLLVDNPNENFYFEDLSIAFNNAKFGLALITTVFDENSKMSKLLQTFFWNENTQQWSAELEDSDSLYYFQKPNLSISDDGYASVCYQVIEMYPSDTINVDNGLLYLWLKNLNTTNDWVEVAGDPMLSDTNTFIWSMTASFGEENKYYVLSEEYDNETGIVKSPKNGVTFGDPDLSMVLRALQVNPDMTISDIPEPTPPTGIRKNTKNITDFNLLKQNYPNPFSDVTKIEYYIMDGSYVTLKIFDYTGKEIVTLVDKKLPAGSYETYFEPGNIAGGVYYYTLTTNKGTITKKMIIAK